MCNNFILRCNKLLFLGVCTAKYCKDNNPKSFQQDTTTNPSSHATAKVSTAVTENQKQEIKRRHQTQKEEEVILAQKIRNHRRHDGSHETQSQRIRLLLQGTGGQRQRTTHRRQEETEAVPKARGTTQAKVRLCESTPRVGVVGKETTTQKEDSHTHRGG